MKGLSVMRDDAAAAHMRAARVAGGARHPARSGLSVSGDGRARNRLTGIRTRGSQGPQRVANQYMRHRCVRFKAL